MLLNVDRVLCRAARSGDLPTSSQARTILSYLGLPIHLSDALLFLYLVHTDPSVRLDADRFPRQDKEEASGARTRFTRGPSLSLQPAGIDH